MIRRRYERPWRKKYEGSEKVRKMSSRKKIPDIYLASDALPAVALSSSSTSLPSLWSSSSSSSKRLGSCIAWETISNSCSMSVCRLIWINKHHLSFFDLFLVIAQPSLKYQMVQPVSTLDKIPLLIFLVTTTDVQMQVDPLPHSSRLQPGRQP